MLRRFLPFLFGLSLMFILIPLPSGGSTLSPILAVQAGTVIGIDTTKTISDTVATVQEQPKYHWPWILAVVAIVIIAAVFWKLSHKTKTAYIPTPTTRVGSGGGSSPNTDRKSRNGPKQS